MIHLVISIKEVQKKSHKGGSIGAVPAHTVDTTDHLSLLGLELGVATATNAVSRLETKFVLASIQEGMGQAMVTTLYLAKLEPKNPVAKYFIIQEPVMSEEDAQQLYDLTKDGWKDLVLGRG